MALAPFERTRRRAENPYTLHAELQQSMNDLVGIIRKEEEIAGGAGKLDELKARGAERRGRGRPGVQPRLAPGASICATCCWSASAWPRPRWSAPRVAGGHTRDDYPAMDAELAQHPAGVPRGRRRSAGARRHRRRPSRRCRCGRTCCECFELSELQKYYTEGELTDASRTERTDMAAYDAKLAGLARRRRRRRAEGLHRRGQRGRGGARHHPPPAGHPGRRSGRAVELQGGQVRLLLGGDQRPAAADVHDPDVDVRPRTRPSR